MEKLQTQKPPESPSVALNPGLFRAFYKVHENDFDQNGVYSQRFQLPPSEPYEDVNISLFKPKEDERRPLLGLSLRTNFDIGSAEMRTFTRIRIIDIDDGTLLAQRMALLKGKKAWIYLDIHETSSVVSLLMATIFNENKQN